MELEQQQDSAIDFLDGKVDFERLHLQLRMLPDVINSALGGSIKHGETSLERIQSFVKNDMSAAICKMTEIYIYIYIRT